MLFRALHFWPAALPIYPDSINLGKPTQSHVDIAYDVVGVIGHFGAGGTNSGHYKFYEKVKPGGMSIATIERLICPKVIARARNAIRQYLRHLLCQI